MTDKLKMDSLKVVLLSQLLVEAIDEVRGTVLYKGKIKQYANTLANILNPMLRSEVDKIYKTDPELTTNVFNSIDSIMKKLTKLNIVDLIMIDQISTHYSQFPEDWQKFFSIEMTRLDEKV